MAYRRSVCCLLGCALTAPRLSAQPAALPRVVYVALAARRTDEADFHMIRESLHQRGYVAGRSLVLEAVFADGDLARAEMQLAEVLKTRVDVFIVAGPAASRAVLRATRSVPIVAVGLHPRGGQTDLFASLAQPGGMATGVSNFGEQLAAKRVQLLIETLPNLKRVGVVHTATDPVFMRWGEETEHEARAQGLGTLRLGLSSPSPEAALALVRGARDQGVQALIVVRDFLTATLRDAIIVGARQARLPTIGEERLWPEGGGLMSYGANTRDVFGRALDHAVRILAGAKPGELPIEQAKRFELVLNRSTGLALGVTFPRPLLLLADEVIG